MTRTIAVLGTLTVSFSLLIFALLQRGAAHAPGAAPAAAGACLAAPVTPAPVVLASSEASCGEATALASAEAR